MNNSNKLEAFIRSHKEEFDSQIPSTQIWDQIEAHVLPNHPKIVTMPKRNLRVWYIAASSIALLGVCVMLILRWDAGSISTPTLASNKMDSSVFYTKGLQQEELHAMKPLATSVSNKKMQLTAVAKDDTVLLNNFKTDIKKLDSNYNILRVMLLEHPNREVLLESMKAVLENQLLLLDKQLMIIQNETPTKDEDTYKHI